MSTIKISQPRIRLVLDQADQLVEYTVQTDNRDVVRFDITRPRKQWPGPQDAPFLFLTFTAWSAMKRTKATELDWDAFLDACVDVEAVDGDGQPITAESLQAGAGAVDPTNGGAEPA